MENNKWYLTTWFISINFALSYFVLPFFSGVVLLILQTKEEKRRQHETEREFGRMADEKQVLIDRLSVLDDYSKLQKEIQALSKAIAEKQSEMITLDDEILYQSFGFYETKYNLEHSTEYKRKLDEIRKKEKEMVKDHKATDHYDNWKVDGSKAKGKKLNNENIRLILYAFNTDCDNAIFKVKFNNIEAMEKRIRTSFEKLNKIGSHSKISIKDSYLQLKLEELYLAYEYEQKKEEEREEQRRIKEQMKEQELLLKEIEEAKAKIEKEERHFQMEISKLRYRLGKASGQEKQYLVEQIDVLQAKLELVEKDREKVAERETNTRAGYVYIISNIGSFGDDVYKIGVTRRFEPSERVRELGSASVPFPFDVHAMIFTEDVFKLEGDLHKAFNHLRVNKVNQYKEFFRVSLNEIEKEVKRNFNKTVEFTKLAEAQQYRETLMKEQYEEIQLKQA